MTACADAQNQPGGGIENAGKTLVVYFSWSGNTRTVANIIRDLTDCDIVEIEVLAPYSSVYNEVTARARQELDNDVRPELRTRVKNMDDYDTLIVGTPIWSSRLAPAVKSFLAGYDLSGKNIAPFCTHGGSGTAQSVNNIRSVCPNSTILQSLAISGSRAGSSRNDVERWLRTINIMKETI
jgi:flavodoxin